MTIPQYCWIQLSTMAHADSSFLDLSKKDWYLQLQSMIIVCFALKGQLWGIRYTPVLVVDKPKGGNDWYWFKSQQAGHFEAIQVHGNHDFHMGAMSIWTQGIRVLIHGHLNFLGIFSLHHLISLKGPGEGKWIVNVHATTGEWSARVGRTFQFFYADCLLGFGWHHTTECTPSRANGTEQCLKSQSTVRCGEWTSGPLRIAPNLCEHHASWVKSCSLNIKAIWGKPATNKPLVYVLLFRPP